MRHEIAKQNNCQLNVSIYGLGNFGFAILRHLDRKNCGQYNLTAYDRDLDLINNLRTKGKHLILHKSHQVSKHINFAQNVETLMKRADILILCVNSEATREVLRNIKKYLIAEEKLVIVNTAKALDVRTGKRLSEVVLEELEGKSFAYGLLSGGTIAKDLFRGNPLGADIATSDKKLLPGLVNLFEAPNLYIYPTLHVAAVEYISAFKNVVAILAGLTKGLGFSYGSETHIISRAADEVEQIIVSKIGSKAIDTKCQSWSNDLWMSCTGATRNREFGIMIGRGKKIDEALALMKARNKTVEGINTLKILNKVARLSDYPLLDILYKFVVPKTISLSQLREDILSKRLLKK